MVAVGALLWFTMVIDWPRPNKTRVFMNQPCWVRKPCFWIKCVKYVLWRFYANWIGWINILCVFLLQIIWSDIKIKWYKSRFKCYFELVSRQQAIPKANVYRYGDLQKRDCISLFTDSHNTVCFQGSIMEEEIVGGPSRPGSHTSQLRSRPASKTSRPASQITRVESRPSSHVSLHSSRPTTGTSQRAWGKDSASFLWRGFDGQILNVPKEK